MESSALTVLLLLGALPAVLGLVMPADCVGKPTCCPMFNGSVCGQDLSRGNCMALPGGMPASKANFSEDERIKFPAKFFNATCRCKGNYDGPACDECKPGFTGDNCNVRQIGIRRNIMKMNQTERNQFWADINFCKCKTDPKYVGISARNRSNYLTYTYSNITYYDSCVFAHNFATRPYRENGIELDNDYDYGHGGPAFFCWHRCHLIRCERAMQRCMNNTNWRFPYYNITGNNGFPLGNNEDLGKNDNNGNLDPGCPFASWRLYCHSNPPQQLCVMSSECQRPRITRNPGPDDEKPGQDYADICLGISTFYSFQNDSFGYCAEFMHNLCHGFIGGIMNNVYLSPNDPLFYMFHCFMDLLLELAIQRYGYQPWNYLNNTLHGHGYDDDCGAMYQAGKLRHMLQNCTVHGYNYER